MGLFPMNVGGGGTDLSLNSGEALYLNNSTMQKTNIINNSFSFSAGFWGVLICIDGLNYSTVRDSYTTIYMYAFDSFDDTSFVYTSGVSINISGKKYLYIGGISSGAHTLTFS